MDISKTISYRIEDSVFWINYFTEVDKHDFGVRYWEDEHRFWTDLDNKFKSKKINKDETKKLIKKRREYEFDG